MNTTNTTSEKELTGYPSIDKPWLKYYSEEARNAQIPECTIYEYMWQNNKDYPNETAIVYFGKKITYRELFENIDKAARAFSAIGIKEGDIVTGIAPSVPEIIYSFYALNRIGAVSNWLDPRTDPSTILQDLNKTETKALLIMDDFYAGLQDIIPEGIDTIIVSAKDSLPCVPQIILSLKSKKNKLNENAIKYKDFIEKYKNSGINACDYKPNMLALLEHTGGTTGVSKAVMMTNENVNSVVEQYRYGGTPLSREHSWLSVAFPFVAYALVCSLHLPLSLGMECQLCFDLDLKKIEKQLLRNHINHMANTPIMWESLIHSPKTQNADFSFLVCPTVGADSLDVEKEKEINMFLRSHDCQYDIIKGYGMTEVGSAVSVCINNKLNKIGSVGIPLTQTVISIFDVDTGEELPFDTQGEICISGPSVMLGYYKNDEETNKVIKMHSDGTVWMHSADLGHMDKDGFLFIDGRIKRMIINHHGFKIFAPTIEKVIQQVKGVSKCCVVGTKDPEYNIGQVPVAYIIPDEDAEKDALLSCIKQACSSQLAEYYFPHSFIFVDKFPYTTAAKVDYRALEKMAEEQMKAQ